MPDLAGMLLRRSVGALTPSGASCSTCERTPLAGERMHEMDTGGRVLCDLCITALPEDERTPVAVQRVHASERKLRVAPRAA